MWFFISDFKACAHFIQAKLPSKEPNRPDCLRLRTNFSKSQAAPVDPAGANIQQIRVLSSHQCRSGSVRNCRKVAAALAARQRGSKMAPLEERVRASKRECRAYRGEPRRAEAVLLEWDGDGLADTSLKVIHGPGWEGSATPDPPQTGRGGGG